MADVELLPLPEPFTYVFPNIERNPLFHIKHMQDYARANVAHHTAAQAAKIEALQEQLNWVVKENDRLLAEGSELTARAERLADALREASGQVRELCDCYGHAYPEASFARYDALLQEQEQNHE